jgi:hypothetical protein
LNSPVAATLHFRLVNRETNLLPKLDHRKTEAVNAEQAVASCRPSAVSCLPPPVSRHLPPAAQLSA